MVSHRVLPRGHKRGVRRVLTICALGLMLCLTGVRASRAEAVVIPAELQAGLLAKLVTHDRSFAARAGDLAQVLLVVRAKNVRSMLAATFSYGRVRNQVSPPDAHPAVQSTVNASPP